MTNEMRFDGQVAIVTGAGDLDKGYADSDLTIEGVRDHWSEILGPDWRPLVFPDESGETHPPYVPSS